MMRSLEQREARQQEMRAGNREEWNPEFLSLEDCARLLHVSRSTARRLFRHEPGVQVWHTPGSRRPIIRVPREVVERVIRRSGN